MAQAQVNPSSRYTGSADDFWSGLNVDRNEFQDYKKLEQIVSELVDMFRQVESHVQVWDTGATADRPSSPSTGQRFFDTDLAKPIWWDGSEWINADGTTAS